MHAVCALRHPGLAAEQALDLVHQPGRQVTDPALACLGVLSREVDRIPRKGEVLELDPGELAHAAAQLVDHAHHQLVAVVHDHIEELVPLFHGQVAYLLAKVLVTRAFSGRFHI